MREEPKPVHTLCHGDFWSNNILFTYGEDPDNPSSLIIIDYQLIFVGSPCYGKFLTVSSSRSLTNHFFFSEIPRFSLFLWPFLPIFIWTFISIFKLDFHFYFPTVFLSTICQFSLLFMDFPFQLLNILLVSNWIFISIF